MAFYRAYFVDGEGHITSVRVLDCSDDDHARAEGGKLADEQAVEIWDGSRMVVRIDARLKVRGY